MNAHNLGAAHFAGAPAFPRDDDRDRRDAARRLARRAGADLDGPAADVADALFEWILANDHLLDIHRVDPGVWAEDTALLALS